MNRFRRRSESKKRSKASASSTQSGSNDGNGFESRRGSTSTVATTRTQDSGNQGGYDNGMSRSISTGSLQLPQTDEDFRTSLILPHLTARFELLRRNDGKLVDFETMQTHLDAQRKTGRLTTFEVDQVLLQYKLQSAAEASLLAPPPLPSSSSKKKRIDWTGIDLEKLSASTSNTSSPLLSISRSPSLSHSSHSNFLESSPTIASSSATSFVSFPHSNSSSSLASTSTIPFNNPPHSSSPPPNPINYTPRRGAHGHGQESNGLFGGRVGGSSSSSGMVKSRSEQSLGGGHGKTGSSLRSFRSIREVEVGTEDESVRGKKEIGVEEENILEGEKSRSEENAGEEEERERESESESVGVAREWLEADADETTRDDRDQEFSEELPTRLTDHQLKRVSTALDSIISVEASKRSSSSSSSFETVDSRKEEEGLHSPQSQSRSSLLRRPLSLLLSVSNPLLSSSSSTPQSPISPITRADLTGVDTFDKPSSTSTSSEPEPELGNRTRLSDPEPIERSNYSRFQPSHPHSAAEIDPTQIPLPPSSSISSSLDSHSEPPTFDLSSTTTRERELTSSTTATDTTTSTISPTTRGGNPEAFSFPFVPHRSSQYSSEEEEEHGEGDRTLLSRASRVELPLSSDDDEGGRNDTMRDSVMSLLSGGGSSFHELDQGIDEEEEEVELPSSPQSMRRTSEEEKNDRHQSGSSREVGVSQEDLLVLATTTNLDSRARGAEGESGQGGGNVGMQDLRVIQDALVRRAEERKRIEMDRRNVVKEDRDRQVIEQDFGDEVANADEEVVLGEKEQEDESISRVSEEGDEVLNKGDDDEFGDSDQEEGDADSSLGGEEEGMGSRKDSVESGITSTGAFDFGDIELAGLGFTTTTHPRTSISTNRRSTRSAKRTSRKSVDTGITGLAPQSTKMEINTSQTSSSPGGFTNSAITPSTSQSDAFEFSSLAGSPDVASWTGGREDLRNDSVGMEEDYSPDIGVSRSPGMQDLSIEHDDQEELDLPDEERDRVEDEQSEIEDQVGDLPQTSNEALPGEPSAALGAPLPIDTTDSSFLRVPRNMPRRDPSSTTSMLIRDVRNQATLATFALKKTPTSPPTRQLSKKSIRKGSISSPHLVSAPTDMATVPIVPSASSQVPVSPRSPHSKVSRSKSRKDKEAGEGEGSKKGLGLRFKMLLKKQSRDHLSLNGDEITPFVDFGAAESTTNRPRPPTDGPPPITPPNQDTARFASPGSNSDFPQTPDQDDPTTPLAVKPKLTSTRSPPRRPPPPGLAAVEELQERPSPPLSVNLEPSVPPPYMPSPVPSTSSGKEGRGLTRLVSRLRGSPNLSARRGSELTSPTTTMVSSIDEAFGGTQSTKSLSRTVSKEEEEQETFGLGIENDGSSNREPPVPYDMRRGRLSNGNEAFPPVANTAPLSVGRNSQTSLAMQAAFTFPPDSASGQRVSRASRNVTRTSGHPVRASTDSMQRLWEAAEDLGLSPDKVQELVDSAYAQSPTTSSNERPASSSSRGNSFSAESHQRQRSTASQSLSHSQSISRSKGNGSLSSHRRGTSEASSSLGHRRKGSSSSSRSLQDRPPTPPPASRHLRKASIASSREAGPIPDLPTSYSSNTIPPSSSANSRLSVSNPQYPPPASPSLGSIISSRRSGYADSFLDFYAQASDDYDEPDIPPVPPLGQHASERSLHSTGGDEYADRTIQPEDLSAEHDDGEVVWQVLSDLRNNRMSVLSKDSSFGFDSRDSSFEVENGANENPGDRSESIANLLRHRDRKRSSVNMPPFQAGGRFPSIYVRDERKLMELGEHGGVAAEQEGHFFVRPKDAQNEALPELPQNYRQNILEASTSSSSKPPSAPPPPPPLSQPESTFYR